MTEKSSNQRRKLIVAGSRSGSVSTEKATKDRMTMVWIKTSEQNSTLVVRSVLRFLSCMPGSPVDAGIID